MRDRVIRRGEQQNTEKQKEEGRDGKNRSGVWREAPRRDPVKC